MNYVIMNNINYLITIEIILILYNFYLPFKMISDILN